MSIKMDLINAITDTFVIGKNDTRVGALALGLSDDTVLPLDALESQSSLQSYIVKNNGSLPSIAEFLRPDVGKVVYISNFISLRRLEHSVNHGGIMAIALIHVYVRLVNFNPKPRFQSRSLYSLRRRRWSNTGRAVFGNRCSSRELLARSASHVPQYRAPYITQEPATQAEACKFYREQNPNAAKMKRIPTCT